MAKKRPFASWIRLPIGILGTFLAFSLLAACESTSSTSSSSPSSDEYRDEVADYCKKKAREERNAFLKEEQMLRKPETDRGVRARQIFNKTYASCMENYNLPVSDALERPPVMAAYPYSLRPDSKIAL